jgi:hypothetical protein
MGLTCERDPLLQLQTSRQQESKSTLMIRDMKLLGLIFRRNANVSRRDTWCPRAAFLSLEERDSGVEPRRPRHDRRGNQWGIGGKRAVGKTSIRAGSGADAASAACSDEKNGREDPREKVPHCHECAHRSVFASRIPEIQAHGLADGHPISQDASVRNTLFSQGHP